MAEPNTEEMNTEEIMGEENVEESPESVQEEAVQEETIQEESYEEESGEQEKKSFFKKKKDKKDEQIEDLTDRLKRQMAEFDNFRKRTEKEKSAMFEVGARNVIERLLPIVDNFERGFSTLTEADMENPFVQGMDKTFKQLMTALEEMEVAPIEAVGKEFDPNLHNAVMHVEDDSVGEGIVVEEFQKGYTYRDSVVRTSMVKVAN